MYALTRLSAASHSCVPSSEHESWTMCSNSTPSWSATEATHSRSHSEFRKLGVIIDNFIRPAIMPELNSIEFLRSRPQRTNPRSHLPSDRPLPSDGRGIKGEGAGGVERGQG